MKINILIINVLGIVLSASHFLFGIEFEENPMYILLSHFLLGSFQFILSIVYVFQRKKTNIILDIHLGLTGICFFLLYLASLPNLNMSENLFFGVLPTYLAVIFTYGAWKFGTNLEKNKEIPETQVVEF